MGKNIGKTLSILFLLSGLVAASSYLIIIDASTSMDDPLPSGQSKIDAAKEAATGFVEASQGNEFAVMKFHTCDDGGDPKSGDIRVIRDLTSDKESLKRSINAITTGSWTPIGEAIAEGRAYIKDELNGRATIILITDGEENCGGDPVLEAQTAYAQGVAVINVVSYAMNETETAAFELHEQIAKAGGGKYYTADNQDELQQVFEKIEGEQSGGSGGACCLPTFLMVFILGAGFVVNRKK